MSHLHLCIIALSSLFLLWIDFIVCLKDGNTWFFVTLFVYFNNHVGFNDELVSVLFSCFIPFFIYLIFWCVKVNIFFYFLTCSNVWCWDVLVPDSRPLIVLVYCISIFIICHCIICSILYSKIEALLIRSWW